MSHAEAIRAAIQAILDKEGDGWNAAQIVVCMSLERVTIDGIVETTPWIWWPPHQADWMGCCPRPSICAPQSTRSK